MRSKWARGILPASRCGKGYSGSQSHLGLIQGARKRGKEKEEWGRGPKRAYLSTVDRKVRDRGPGEGDPSTKEKKVNSVASKQKDFILFFFFFY